MIDPAPRPYDPAQDPANPATRLGWKEPEFWLALVALLLTALAASNLFPADSIAAKLVALGLGVLTAGGYSANKLIEKLRANAAAKEIKLAKVSAEADKAIAEITGQVPVHRRALRLEEDDAPTTTTTTTTETSP